MIRLNSLYAGIELQAYSNGMPVVPDSPPTAVLSRNGTATGVTVTIGTTADTGRYLASFTTLGSAQGWVVSDHLTLRATALIDGTSYPAIVFDSYSHPPEIADANVVAMTSNVITAAAVATNAIDADALATSAIAEIQAGLSTYAGDDTEGVTTLLSRLSPIRANYLDNLTNLDALVSAIPTLTEIEASEVLFKVSDYTAPDNDTITTIGTRTARVDGLISNASGSDRFTANALSNTPVTTVDLSGINTALSAIQGEGFDVATDSLRSLRARGDSAWVTATGFSTLTAQNVADALKLAPAAGSTSTGSVYSVLTAINTKTANLPTSPASTGDVQVTVSGGFSESDRANLAAIPTLTEIENSAVLAKQSTAQAAVNLAAANL